MLHNYMNAHSSKRLAMLKTVLFVPVAAIALLSSCANNPPLAQTNNPPKQMAAAAPLSYESYGTILRTYVNDKGLVDYPA
jgi:uncharacterized lipoprotein YajG